MLTINNTLDGYLKDVEIKGNTIQNSENLADIRSVGDKVEGQELYEIPVLSVGKNLFDGYVEIGWVDSSGNLMDLNRSRTNLIKINPNTKYVLSSSNRYQFRVVFYTVNNVYISETVNMCDTKGMIFTTPTNCKYVRFMYAETVENSTSWKIQLEEGTVATPYEPYQEDKLTILSPTPLEKVGDVRDRIICKDGVWGVEKNIIESVLDSNTIWSGLLTVDGYTSGWRTNNYSIVICDKLKQLTLDEWRSNTVKGLYSSSSNMGIIIPSSELNSNSSNGLNEWIKNNQPSVKYPTTQPQFIPLPHDQQVKLRTFANKTNISFLTEIEGTIKAQVPKSLGATVNTHTEQIRSLNNELNRVKKLEESTVSTVETESDFTTVEATSNGYFEDVKLEGKTLVNKSIRKSIDFSTRVNTIYEGEAINNVTLSMLAISNSTTNGIKLAILNEDDSSNYVILYGSNTTGVYLQYLSRDKKFKKLSVYIDLGDDGAGLKGAIDNILILEGDHTQNPPSGYIEGLKSVGDGIDEVSVKSVKGDGNLVEYIELNGVSSGDGSNFTDNKYVRTNYIIVEPNQTYYIKYPTNALYKNCAVYFYDSNKSYLGYKSGVTSEFTTVTNTKFIRIDMKKADNTGNTQEDINNCDFIVSKCRVSEYIPRQSDKKRLLYYNNETQTWEKPILREWDSIEKHADGKYYYHQRSGEVVLNGSENWRTNSTDDTNLSSQFILANYPLDIAETKDHTTPQLISDTIPATSSDAIGSSTLVNEVFGVAVRIKGNKGIFIALPKSKLSTQDLAGFKQWLQTNNVTVAYQLAQEKVYECTNIDLITYANETNYIVESGAIAPRSTLKVHNNISNVVSLLQKKVSLLESNITSYMITQNRLMLASRYNADTVSFKVDVASLRDTFEYDNDLYELILNNILAGKDNYNREYIENLIIFYWMDFIISDEMYSTLFEIIEEQHNPKIEEETPLI